MDLENISINEAVEEYFSKISIDVIHNFSVFGFGFEICRPVYVFHEIHGQWSDWGIFLEQLCGLDAKGTVCEIRGGDQGESSKWNIEDRFHRWCVDSNGDFWEIENC